MTTLKLTPSRGCAHWPVPLRGWCLASMAVLLAGSPVVESTPVAVMESRILDPVADHRDHSQLIRVLVGGRSIGKSLMMHVYLPKGYSADQRYPVIYLLHGMGSDQTLWKPWLGLHSKADALIDAGAIRPVVIAAPHYDNSYGINSAEQAGEWDRQGDRVRHYGRYEDFLMKDVIDLVESRFSVDTLRKSRYIGGLSMGGFAALHLAFRHPDRFAKVGGMSSALQSPEINLTVYNWLYPTEQQRRERDPLLLAETRDLSGIKVYLSCGDRDDFSKQNRKLAERLLSRGVHTTYLDKPGQHDDDYWRADIESFLRFFAGDTGSRR